MKQRKNKVILCILDGFGAGEENEGNAILAARAPNLKRLLANYPNSRLQACGPFVGLPEGQMGNSEIGHMTIGAGRVIETSLTIISNSIARNEFSQKEQIQKIAKNASDTHIIGLCSGGGIHSHADHILATAEALRDKRGGVFLHLISDGRDAGFDDFASYVGNFFDKMSHIQNACIATVCGRYYAMDRDKNYERTAVFGDLILGGIGKRYILSETSARQSLQDSIAESYDAGVYDEFLTPKKYCSFDGVKASDDIIFVNFRPDRMRQIVEMAVKSRIRDVISAPGQNPPNNLELTKQAASNETSDLESLALMDFSSLYQDSWVKDRMKNPNVGSVLCMTDYFADKNNPVNAFIECLFTRPPINNSLGEVVSKNNKSQIRIAETEKYAHVTYFFNGGVDIVFNKEERILIPSAKVKTHDLFPQMRAEEIALSIINAARREVDFIAGNFANCDMVGHTGNFEATVKSVEALDASLGPVIEEGLNLGYDIIITADHGNADAMLDASGKKSSKHSLNPVYFILVSNRLNKSFLSNGALADVAPTILDIMGLDKPVEMTGKSLIARAT